MLSSLRVLTMMCGISSLQVSASEHFDFNQKIKYRGYYCTYHNFLEYKDVEASLQSGLIDKAYEKVIGLNRQSTIRYKLLIDVAAQYLAQGKINQAYWALKFANMDHGIDTKDEDLMKNICYAFGAPFFSSRR